MPPSWYFYSIKYFQFKIQFNVNISIFSALLLYLISHIAYGPEINGTENTASLPLSLDSSPTPKIQDKSPTTKRSISTKRPPSYHVTTWKMSTSDVASSQINSTSITPISKSSNAYHKFKSIGNCFDFKICNN